MEKDLKKPALQNESFKERFQFQLWINENIICQRYFKIMGFNSDSIGSEELLDTLETCVYMIKDDLHYKSFLYQSIVNDEPVKMCGFHNNMDNLHDLYLLTNSKIDGNVILSDGTEILKEYFNYTDDINEIYDDEHLNPWDVTFKFEFLIDNRIVFQRIWDGSVYPKFVRNSVDLSNSLTSYTRGGGVNFISNEGISNYLKVGRVDLIYYMIKKIVECMSYGFDDPDRFTHTINFDNYATVKFVGGKTDVIDVVKNECSSSDNKTEIVGVGKKEYYYESYNKKYYDSYYKWTKDKSRKYNAWLNRSEKYSDSGGLTPGEWEHFEKRC